MAQSPPRFGDREPADRAPEAAPAAYPVYELSVAAVRELDRRCTTQYGIPSIVLMENAARNLRDHALEMLAGARRPDALIACGPGANGGDGLALARHLASFGVPVRILLLAAPKPGSDAAVNLGVVRAMGLPVLDPDADPGATPGLVVDAVFGTGLDRPPSGPAAGLIERVNAMREGGALVLSVDLPSGLDAETGEPLGPACVRADRTVTLAAVKPGLSRLEAQAWLGDLAVADIGAPACLLAELGVPWRGFPGENPAANGV